MQQQPDPPKGTFRREATAQVLSEVDDRKRGIVAAPGLNVLGLPYLRHRKSSFIHGAEDDVRELSSHLGNYLDLTARRQVSGMLV